MLVMDVFVGDLSNGGGPESVLGRGPGLFNGGNPLGGLPKGPPGLGSEGRVPADLPIGGRAPGNTLSNPFPPLPLSPPMGGNDGGCCGNGGGLTNCRGGASSMVGSR